MRPIGSPKTPGSGRKKGTKNKESLPLKEKSEQLGIDPFEILLYFTQGDWKSLGYSSQTETKYTQSGQSYEVDIITPDHRITAASQACQYLYPKLKTIEHSHTVDQTIEVYDFRHDDDETSPNPIAEKNSSSKED